MKRDYPAVGVVRGRNGKLADAPEALKEDLLARQQARSEGRDAGAHVEHQALQAPAFVPVATQVLDAAEGLR